MSTFSIFLCLQPDLWYNDSVHLSGLSGSGRTDCKEEPLLETLILASQSPRRRELLSQAGLPFEIFVPHVDETCFLPARDAVAELSRRKASACISRFPGRVILASDTLVALDGRSFGNPRSPQEALSMLSALSGRTHQVFTGVTVISPEGQVFTDADDSSVTFCSVPEEELAAYVRSGEPMDKAGAYAVQGRAGLWITRLEGSFSSVIGLPLHLVRSLLLQAGYPLLSAWER